MARAAVLPPSPAKRVARTAPRVTLNKTTKAKTTADTKKRAPVRATAPTTHDDLDSDTDDELGMMMEETKQAARPKARPTARQATKPPVPRGRKATQPAPTQASNDNTEATETASAAPKKRPGRPKKVQTEEPAAKPTPAPKPRGRPKADATKTTTTTRKTTRAATGTDSADSTAPKNIVIATNSTTMRSNILRGPAKKKTVTFQDVSDSESEEDEEAPAPAAGRRKAAPKAAAKKTGLGSTPMRKATTTTGRGRKPVAAKKAATKPLSPKKAKQMAKSLSAYASSDGEEDELSSAKEELKSPVKLVVHSPMKQPTEPAGLTSPVRRINFTPKKTASLVDENGEPKLPTPKHGSSTGLSSPVRRINFTPNRSQNTVADNGHLALPPGKSIDFSDSVFMSSPARRPEPSSPFRFSFRDTPNRGSLFRDELNAAPALNLSHGPASPLKMSPRKGHLGASFSQSPSKGETPSFPARSSLIQSPAKRIASPFKSSLFSKSAPIQSTGKIESPLKTSSLSSMTRRLSSHQESEETEEVDEDLEMVEEVARDIFGIELQSDSKNSSQSPSPQNTMVNEVEPELELSEFVENEDEDEIEIEHEHENERENESVADEDEEADIDHKLEELKAEIQQEPEDFGTLCFNTMEEFQRPVVEDYALEEDSEVEAEMDVDVDVVDSISEAESEQDELSEEFHMPSVEPTEAVTDLAPSTEQDDEDLSVHGTPQSESPLNLAVFEEDEFEDPESPTPAPVNLSIEVDEEDEEELEEQEHLGEIQEHEITEENEDLEEPEDFEDQENVMDNISDTGSVIHQPYEEQEPESDHEEVIHHSPSPTPSDATFTVLDNLHSPYEIHSGGNSPLRMGPVPPLAPTPPVYEDPFTVMDSAKSHSRIFDISNTEPRAEVMESPMETTQTDIPTPVMPKSSNTPSALSRRGSAVTHNLGFTPLANQFGRWDNNSPSRPRSVRPRRRGVFSLVGPLERSAETHIPDEGDVSYPDLSRPFLENTPHLFSELPLHHCSDDTAMTPASASKYTLDLSDDDDMIDSLGGADIFEDLQPVVPAHLRSRESLPRQPIVNDEPDFSPEEDKENTPAPAPLPATPMKAVPNLHRTVHTVSKVPLKGEGEISPLKMPRKRGLSLSNASPTRSSSRIRNSILLPRTDSAPALSSDTEEMQVPRSPSPKRRCSADRRSSVRRTSMPPPKSPSVASSHGKTPRRNPSPKKAALQGAVVYVDVHTTEGEDASGIFIELLQQMGARCFKSWSWNPRASMSPVDGVDPSQTIGKVGITHVVYKDGGLRTLEKVKYAGGLVKCVGVGWVLE